jgi:sialate O-acetylesterase
MKPNHLVLILCAPLLLFYPAKKTVAKTDSNPTTLPFLSPIFGSHMVLQRGKPDAFWGWSTPGDTVRVSIGNDSATATAAPDGRWQVNLTPPPPGGPYTVDIVGAQSAQLQDVLVGDVWLCGGQSNMELGLSQVKDGPKEVADAKYPQVRLFMVSSYVSYAPAATPQGTWKVCSPKTVAEGGPGGFSAVAYFFGSDLNDKLHVPIGLIEDCIGGTSAETWTSRPTLTSLGGYDAQFAEIDRLAKLGGPQYGNFIMHWYDQYDPGIKNPTWFAADFDDSHWQSVQIPGGFADLGVPSTPAVCWFRKTINLQSPPPPGTSRIYLGEIEQMDTVWVNGRWIGASAWVENPRIWTVPPGVLKPGPNLITLRIFKVKKNGGFLSDAKTLRLVLGDNTAIPLAGQWKGALSVDARPPHPMPLSFENWPSMPSVLYQGMIQPLAPLSLTGAIWYQGEANVTRANQYEKVLTVMIGDWRALFAQGNFPFYIVSLPAFQHHRENPAADGWTDLREAQIQTAGAVSNSAVAITVDTGDPDSIHPKEKRIVGYRLALCALAKTYGQTVDYQGPTFHSLTQLPSSLQIYFDHTDNGLVAKGNTPREFSIAGPDHQWHWATAKIVGNTIIISSPDVPTPVDARYAWQANPIATLYNGEGLPAVPFSTHN